MRALWSGGADERCHWPDARYRALREASAAVKWVLGTPVHPVQALARRGPAVLFC